MMSTVTTPNSTGTQAPSTIFIPVAITKTVSTTVKGSIRAAAAQSGHCHCFQMTMNPSTPATHVVAATANT